MSTLQTVSPEQPVHWAIALTAKAGKESELEEALLRFAQRSLDDRGATGVHLFRPVPGSGSREFLLHRSFRSREHSQRFYESELFRQYQRETDPLLEQEAVIRPLHGFEAFFRGAAAPPRWKMAVATWLGVYPAVLLWTALLAPRLFMLHPFLVTAAITIMVVLSLTWVIMPRLTKALRPWLSPIPVNVYRRVPRH